MLHETHNTVYTAQYVFQFSGERKYSNDGGIKGTAKVFNKNIHGKQSSQIYEGEVFVPIESVQFTAQ